MASSMVEVKYLGKLRELTGAAKEEVELPTVKEALAEVGARHGPDLRALFFPDGNESQLNGDLDILVNGRSISFIDGLDTRLNKEDTITILYHGIRGFPGG